MKDKKTEINVLSIDVEDWYLSYDSSQIDPDKWPLLESRVEQGTGKFLHFLKEKNQQATFFILGWIAERHPELIRRIAAQGHDIGYHSCMHTLPVRQGRVAFEEDLAKGIDLLSSLSGKEVMCYRAPMFSLCETSAWTIPILLKHGIRVSSSYKAHRKFNGHRIPSTPFFFESGSHRLLEMPLNRLKLPLFNWIYTGSGYFRIMPFWMISFLFKRSSYNMSYFHPRDFDNKVPSTEWLPAYRNWMSRVGNATTLKKLEALMAQHAFMSVGEAATVLADKDLPVVSIHAQ